MAKILLVDDAEDILFVLEQSFRKAGHKVLATSDPRRVMPMTRTGRFDAIVLDVMMPQITGWSLLSQIREQPETRSTPVVLLTALSSVSDRVRGLRRGADDYLTKPFEPAELIVRVERLIQRRATPSAALQGQLELHSVEDVLQQLEQGRKTGKLEIHSDAGDGTMTLRSGAIVAADHDGLEGEEAVLDLLGLTSGSFYFHADERNGTHSSMMSVKIGPLLIRSAWIDDELERRRHLLPAPSVPISIEGSLPEQPQCLPPMPLFELQAPLARPGGITLEQLWRAGRSASKRISLAIAWLAEEGVLSQQDQPPETDPGDVSPPDPFSEDDERLENLDVAIREFLQSGLYCGLNLDNIHLEVYLAPGAWAPGLELLSTVPPSLVTPPGPSIRKPFDCPLRHPAGTVSMRWIPLAASSSAAVPDPPPDCAGVVLWLDQDWPTEDLAALGARLAGRAQSASCVLLSPSSIRDPDLVGFSVDPQWRAPVSRPETFEQLLLELAQADPHAETEN